MTRTEERDNPIHQHIATALRRARILRGMSQQDLAARTGVTYQQIQKYENGKSRITAVRLLHILSILDIPCPEFMTHIPTGKTGATTKAAMQLDDITLQICRRLMTVDDPAYKKRIKDVIFSLAPERETE